ncbi:MAG: hypothetical protein JNJ61_10705 [Anaerolineae bacterium]|nr:hypothetical protein [Anaerolineae bacterium]
MTDYDLLDPGANWCPDCGLPRGVCDCEFQDKTAIEYDVHHLDINRCPRCGECISVDGYCMNLECVYSYHEEDETP